MLDELHIANLGVIRDASLTLVPGLNVVTGETGAGKTMLVTALQLLTGGRGDATLVRTGADAAVVEARWAPAPTALARWLAADDAGADGEAGAGADGAGADDEAGAGAGDAVAGDVAESGATMGEPVVVEAVVQRRIQASGRSRVRIEGHLATVGALEEVVAPAVEIHAQDSHRRLLEPATQRRLLDGWGGAVHLEAVAAHAAAHAHHAQVLARRDELAASVTTRAREMDHLEREVAEIDAAGLSEDDEELEQRIDELVHADELRGGLQTAGDALGVDGAGEPLGVAVDALRRLPTETSTSEELRARVDEV
ncbi:MAG TPA: AAA family ATPase, partial [Nitriliruptoraceae bacterium]|nr:AAA family ATPase [Nitriliruptoraceae bacterium]